MTTAIATKTMKHRTTVIWKKLVMMRVKAAKMTRRMTRRKGPLKELERQQENVPG
jgi:predicted methyltransferase